MIGFQVSFLYSPLPPGDLGVGGIGQDEGLQLHVWDIEAGFQFFDFLVELNLGVAETFQIADAFGVYKYNVLFFADDQP